MATPIADSYSGIPSGITSVQLGRGTPYVPPAVVPSGTVVTLAQSNSRSDMDPKLDPLANPSYPGTGPWAVGVGYVWSTVTDYSGAVFVPTLGAAGAYLQYGAAGHAAYSAPFWFGYYVAEQEWRRVGARPLPSSGLSASGVLGYPPDPACWDATWGDYNGGWAGWPAGFSQPGIIVPEGSHTRNRMLFRPPAAAGNTKGQIIVTWRPSGAADAGSAAGSWVYDLDTLTFARTANLRPSGFFAHAGGAVYHAGLDVVTAPNQSPGAASTLDWLNCATMTWTARNLTGGTHSYGQGPQAFGWIDSAGKHWHVCYDSIAGTHWGIRAEDVMVAGANIPWVDMTVSAPDGMPPIGPSSQFYPTWSRCAADGCYYIADGVTGGTVLYKLTPPVSGVFTDTWVISKQTLAGDAIAINDNHYGKLQWCPSLTAFLWTGRQQYFAGVQGIRPIGI